MTCKSASFTHIHSSRQIPAPSLLSPRHHSCDNNTFSYELCLSRRGIVQAACTAYMYLYVHASPASPTHLNISCYFILLREDPFLPYVQCRPCFPVSVLKFLSPYLLKFPFPLAVPFPFKRVPSSNACVYKALEPFPLASSLISKLLRLLVELRGGALVSVFWK